MHIERLREHPWRGQQSLESCSMKVLYFLCFSFLFQIFCINLYITFVLGKRKNIIINKNILVWKKSGLYNQYSEFGWQKTQIKLRSSYWCALRHGWTRPQTMNVRTWSFSYHRFISCSSFLSVASFSGIFSPMVAHMSASSSAYPTIAFLIRPKVLDLIFTVHPRIAHPSVILSNSPVSWNAIYARVTGSLLEPGCGVS